MPGLFDKVTKLARTPQGRRLAEQAQQMAKDPKNREKIAQLRSRLGRRGTPPTH
jgi:hypothetical protein